MSTASMKKNRVMLNNVGVEVKENEMKRTVNNELTCVSIVEQVTKIKDPHACDGKAEEDKSQKDNSSDSDFVFMTTTTTTAKSSLPTVQVRINGIKG